MVYQMLNTITTKWIVKNTASSQNICVAIYASNTDADADAGADADAQMCISSFFSTEN